MEAGRSEVPCHCLMPRFRLLEKVMGMFRNFLISKRNTEHNLKCLSIAELIT